MPCVSNFGFQAREKPRAASSYDPVDLNHRASSGCLCLIRLDVKRSSASKKRSDRTKDHKIPSKRYSICEDYRQKFNTEHENEMWF